MKPLQSLLLILLILAGTSPPLKSSQMDANELMSRVIKIAKEHEKIRLDTYNYAAYHVIKDFDEHGREKNRKTEKILISNNNGTKSMTTIERNGEKPDDPKPSGYQINPNEILATRYEYKMAQNEPVTIGDKSYYIVEFWPKKGLKNNTDEDQVINRGYGQIFIQCDNLFLWKIVARTGEFSVGWFIFKMYYTNLEFEQQLIDGIAAEKVITMNGKYKVDKLFTSSTTIRNEFYAFPAGEFQLK